MSTSADSWLHVFLGMAVALLIAAPVVEAAAVPESAAAMSPQEQALLEEYGANYQRLQRCYDNIRMEALRRKSLIPALETEDNPQGRDDTRLLYRANGGKFYRMDVISLDYRDGTPTGETRIRLIRPEGYAVAERHAPDRPFVVSEWTHSRDQGLNELSGYIFPWSPYTMLVVPMKTLVSGGPVWAKDYRLEKVVAHGGGGERLVTVTARAITTRGESQWHGFFVFYRDRSWALKEVSSEFSSGQGGLVTPNDFAHRGRYEYEGMYEGVPLLKKVEYWREQGPHHKRVLVQVYDVVSVQPGPVPEEEFSPAVLGVEAVGQRSHWVRLMLGMLGAVLLLLLYFFLRRKERKSAG